MEKSNEIIPYGRQDISKDDIDEVVKVLRSDFITQGPAVPRFENSISQYCQASHAIAVNSATSALHIACLALGLRAGDYLWTSAITFVASANCALYCGASVDFVDIDPRTYNLSIEHLSEKLIQAEKIGKLPKIVVPVHLCGQSCEMSKIQELSQKYGFKIIEDASHAIGGKYKGRPIGSCDYSDITVFSFHPVKIITTGEGGIAVTNNADLAELMLSYRSHGISNSSKDMIPQPKDEIWNYQQIRLGYNFRMTDIQAALGASQMSRLDDLIQKRHEIAEFYGKRLKKLPLVTPWQHPDSYSSYHLYLVLLNIDKISKTHRQVFDAMRSNNILVNLHYIPVYRQPYYQSMGFKINYCPVAESYFRKILSLPMFPTLKGTEQNRTIEILGNALLA